MPRDTHITSYSLSVETLANYKEDIINMMQNMKIVDDN